MENAYKKIKAAMKSHERRVLADVRRANRNGKGYAHGFMRSDATRGAEERLRKKGLIWWRGRLGYSNPARGDWASSIMPKPSRYGWNF